MLLLGFGFALTFPSINSQATAGVADHEQGLASGLVNTSVQVGGAAMMAVVTAIIGSASAEGGAPVRGELLPGMVTGVAVVVGLVVLAALGSWVVVARMARGARVEQRDTFLAAERVRVDA